MLNNNNYNIVAERFHSFIRSVFLFSFSTACWNCMCVRLLSSLAYSFHHRTFCILLCTEYEIKTHVCILNSWMLSATIFFLLSSIFAWMDDDVPFSTSPSSFKKNNTNKRFYYPYHPLSMLFEAVRLNYIQLPFVICN